MTDDAQPDRPDNTETPNEPAETQDGAAQASPSQRGPAEDQPSPADQRIPAPDVGPKPRKNSAAIKLLFLVALVGIGVAIYFIQNRPAEPPPGWLTSLDAAERLAEKEDRPMLLLVTNSPPGEMGMKILNTPLRDEGNRDRIKKANYVAAMVEWDEAIERKYEVKLVDLPVLLAVDSKGKVAHRHNGYVGQIPFRDEFLAKANKALNLDAE